MERDARIAVAVITRDRREEAVTSIGRLLDLPERPEVILVDNASSDGTPDAVASAYGEATIVRLAENRGAAARNVAARRTEAPYLAFCDDDSWWRPGALRVAADLLDAHPRLAVVAASVIVEPGGRLDPTCAEMAAGLPAEPDLPGPPVVGFVACGAVVRRSAFLAAGGFPPELGVGGEESWLATELTRRGWSLCYCPEIVAHHAPSAARNPRARRRRQLRNDLWLEWSRRDARTAARATRTLLRRTPSPAGALDALAGTGWVLSRRRPVPRAFERSLATLEGR